MNLFYSALIATVLVIGLGISLVVPVFFEGQAEAKKQVVMLSFSIDDQENLPTWCSDLNSLLLAEELRGTIFVTGRVADEYPNCVAALSSNPRLDIGTQTYDNAPLDSTIDYSEMLLEVQRGKEAVDKAGSIESRVFKAPLGKTDENIYSLLNRSSILADFTYATYYTQFDGEHYIWFNVTSYDGSNTPADSVNRIESSDSPLVIDFDNRDPISIIKNFVSDLDRNKFALANASDLTRLELTVRERTE